MMDVQRDLKFEELVALVPLHLGVEADGRTRTGHLCGRKRGDRDDDLDRTLVVLDRRLDRSTPFNISSDQHHRGDDPLRICRAGLNDPDGVKAQRATSLQVIPLNIPSILEKILCYNREIHGK